MPIPGATIPGAETQGLFQRRDRLLDRAGQELAPAEIGLGARLVAIELDYRLIFEDGGLASASLAQQVTLSVTCNRVAR